MDCDRPAVARLKHDIDIQRPNREGVGNVSLVEDPDLRGRTGGDRELLRSKRKLYASIVVTAPLLCVVPGNPGDRRVNDGEQLLTGPPHRYRKQRSRRDVRENPSLAGAKQIQLPQQCWLVTS